MNDLAEQLQTYKESYEHKSYEHIAHAMEARSIL